METDSYKPLKDTLKEIDIQMSYSSKYFDLAIVLRVKQDLKLLVIETENFLKKTQKSLQATKETLNVNDSSVIGCRHITLQGH